jgi:hypothetical protein
MNGSSREEIEAEMALKFLARANPPPILFRYRRPSDWAVDEISKQELYAATSQELNDPTLIQMGCDFDRFILTESVV